MNRFFVNKNQIYDNKIEILGKDVKHIKNVLRLKPKDMLEIVSEGKCYICEILEFKTDIINVRIVNAYDSKNEPPIHIVIFQGIAKGDKMDFIIQKNTEIGVKEIFPLLTKRTVVKIKNKKKEKSKVDRWNSIAEEAAKQSKRDSVPLVHDVINFHDMIDILKKEKNIVVPYEMENSHGLKEALKSTDGNRVNIVIGPEGGFEEEEIKKLKAIGGQIVTLGPRILRTETAGIVTSSLVLYELGDLGVIV